jgi:hypothetical protein
MIPPPWVMFYAGSYMQLLMLIGPYAGELRDVRALNARRLVELGQALDPNMPAEVPLLVVPAEVNDESLPSVAKLSHRLRKGKP